MEDAERNIPRGQHALEAARLDIRAHHALRQERDAEPGEHGRSQHYEIVTDEPRRDLDVRDLAAAARHLPFLSVRLGRESECVALSKIFRPFGPSRTLEIRGTRD